jgi:perosamine synthetase
VIVPTFTFIATANAVTYTGARPVFVDSEALSWNIDPGLIEAAITERTKAIIPVHLYGHPADMDPILNIAARHKLAVVEDAAEAHGARYKGRPVGGLGTIGIFSFYGNKTITTGEGGMVVTDRAELAEQARVLRDHGMSKERRYWHTVLGYNYRMTNLQAALGVAQMERADAILAKKAQIAQLYNQGLQCISGLTLPPQAGWAESVCWLYTILVNEERLGLDRDTLMEHLKAQGIETRPVFPCIHQQPIYSTGQRLPVAERLSASGISLPSAPNLQTVEIERIVQAFKSLPGQHA